MANIRLWMRWSWRDLRRRWLAVTVIALIIGVGTGVSAGFTSLTVWSRTSYDRSYEQLNMYDLRVRLSPGSFAPEGALPGAIRTIPDSARIDHIEERLVVPVQVDASTPSETILVPGELMGLTVTDGGPTVNALHVARGRALGPADSGRPIALLRTGFARAHDLPTEGTVRLVGGVEIQYVGFGSTPDYFVITSRAAGFASSNHPNFGVLFTSLLTAQSLGGQPGGVNDVVLTLMPGMDREAVRGQVEAALRERLPGVSATVLTLEQDEGRNLVYDDSDSGQRMVDIMAWLILAGATLAAFNLTSRLVEAQRREIGIGMALGVWPIPLAIRPLLFAAQVSVLGVLLGIPVGLLIDEALKRLVEDSTATLAVWQTPFAAGTYARSAAIGFALPFAAAIYPIIRATRAQPIDAIRTGFLAAHTGGLAPLVRRLPLPGRSLGQMPLRNILRTPRRTLLTALAVAGAILVFAGSMGLLDTFNDVIDRQDAHTAGVRDRVEVQLDGFHPLDSEAVRAVRSASVAGATDAGLRIEGTVLAGTRQVNLMIDVLDLGGAMWTPAVTDAVPVGDRPAVVLSERAASDLHVRPGDTITLRHPRREADGFRLVETPVVVRGLHGGAFRYNAYMDQGQGALFGLSGATNFVQLRPAAGASVEAVQRALFGLPGVALTQPADAVGARLRDSLSTFRGILGLCLLAALALVLLIGSNAATITADERAREHATMFAFGLPVWTVLRVNVTESALLGLLGGAIGVPAGFLMMKQVVDRTLSPTYPELGLEATFSTTTVLVALTVALLSMAAAPLLTWRRMVRTNIPATLRVVE